MKYSKPILRCILDSSLQYCQNGSGATQTLLLSNQCNNGPSAAFFCFPTGSGNQGINIICYDGSGNNKILCSVGSGASSSDCDTGNGAG